jgi:hypothetical protein
VGRSAALLVLSGAALAAAGCGASKPPRPQALALERADLVAVARVLAREEPAIRSEVTATKAAWPLIIDGLPARSSTVTITQPAIRTAVQRAAALTLPAIFEEREAGAITGPGSGIGSTYRAFSILAGRGWRMIGADAEAVEHGSPAAARFARANVALYIESVYDAHFGLGQIGKRLLAGYKALGGATAFGSTFTQAEANALADAYSQASDQLRPHARVRLGS